MDSLIFHSGLSPQPAEVSGEVAALFVRLHSGLISAAALVEDHQKYRELIGDLMPQMEELITDDGPIAAKLHNVLSHLQRGDSFLLQGNLTEGRGERSSRRPSTCRCGWPQHDRGRGTQGAGS